MIKININYHTLGRATILSNVDLEIPGGSISGLVGTNGAGKSTLLRIMSGVYKADDGTVEYDGESILKEETRKRVFFLPDDPYFNMQTTALSMVKMYRVFYPDFDMSAYKELVAKFGINEKKPLRNCSKGMRRQIYIAVALAVKPEYLLLDEAFDGLDPLSRKIFKESIISLVEENGTTVVISSHALREIEDFCDTYIFIDNKTVSSYGDMDKKVAKYSKFQLAFKDEVSEERFASLPVVSLAINGRFVTLVIEGEGGEMLERLERLEPAVVEELPVDFEEVFVNEAQKGGKR